jgi:hypothetical protein
MAEDIGNMVIMRYIKESSSQEAARIQLRKSIQSVAFGRENVQQYDFMNKY